MLECSEHILEPMSMNVLSLIVGELYRFTKSEYDTTPFITVRKFSKFFGDNNDYLELKNIDSFRCEDSNCFMYIGEMTVKLVYSAVTLSNPAKFCKFLCKGKIVYVRDSRLRYEFEQNRIERLNYE